MANVAVRTESSGKHVKFSTLQQLVKGRDEKEKPFAQHRKRHGIRPTVWRSPCAVLSSMPIKFEKKEDSDTRHQDVTPRRHSNTIMAEGIISKWEVFVTVLRTYIVCFLVSVFVCELVVRVG